MDAIDGQQPINQQGTRQWNTADERNNMLNRLNLVTHSISQSINHIDEIFNRSSYLPNIGRIVQMKFAELEKLFADHNLNFYEIQDEKESKSFRLVVYHHFISILESEIKKFEVAVKKMQVPSKVLPSKLLHYYFQIFSGNDIKEYEGACDFIDNYSLPSGIVESFITYCDGPYQFLSPQDFRYIWNSIQKVLVQLGVPSLSDEKLEKVSLVIESAEYSCLRYHLENEIWGISLSHLRAYADQMVPSRLKNKLLEKLRDESIRERLTDEKLSTIIEEYKALSSQRDDTLKEAQLMLESDEEQSGIGDIGPIRR